jgi:hypothetical protein
MFDPTTGSVRVRPAMVAAVPPSETEVLPMVREELASLTLVTLASTILAVVTDKSTGVLTSDRRVSVP